MCADRPPVLAPSYLPSGWKIRPVPGDRFAVGWGGRCDWDQRTLWINDTLPPDIRRAIIWHEAAHARWSAPLPDIPGQAGGAQLALEMFDELRTEAFMLAADPSVRDDTRAWIFDGLPESVEVPNSRGAAIVYGSFVGRVLTGALEECEVAATAYRLRSQCGVGWGDDLDVILADVLRVRPGENGELVRLARRWDSAALTLV